MKIRTKSTGTDKKGVCWSTLNPLVIILRAHFYTGIPRMCVLRSEHPRHLNVWGVLRHCVPNKGLHPLRRYAAILADLVSRNGFANRPRRPSFHIVSLTVSTFWRLFFIQIF